MFRAISCQSNVSKISSMDLRSRHVWLRTKIVWEEFNSLSWAVFRANI